MKRQKPDTQKPGRPDLPKRLRMQLDTWARKLESYSRNQPIQWEEVLDIGKY